MWVGIYPSQCPLETWQQLRDGFQGAVPLANQADREQEQQFDRKHSSYRVGSGAILSCFVANVRSRRLGPGGVCQPASKIFMKTRIVTAGH